MSCDVTATLKKSRNPQRRRNPKLTQEEYHELCDILVNRWAPEAVLLAIRERLAN